MVFNSIKSDSKREAMRSQPKTDLGVGSIPGVLQPEASKSKSKRQRSNCGPVRSNWQWCAVSFWLCQNNIIKKEIVEEASITFAINRVLEAGHLQCAPDAELRMEIEKAVAEI